MLSADTSRTDNRSALQPVRFIPSDATAPAPSPGIALCLSGGGYRAMLFHVGSLWRLNEIEFFKKLIRISSVSGGSITAAMLGLKWQSLAFNPETGVATNLRELLIDPILALAGRTIDIPAVLLGLLPGNGVSKEIARAYRRHLYQRATLQDLPLDRDDPRSVPNRTGPRFVINSTNLQDKVLWRFSRPYMGDYRVGLVRSPAVELAVAVAASSAFPPFLSPVVLKLDPATFDKGTDGGLQRAPYDSEVVLTDGGVYDNLGLETAWKRCETILVSDGGGITADELKPSRNWLGQAYRVLNLFNNDVGSLRKRQVITSYQLGLRTGAYWGIRTDIANYQLPDSLPCPVDRTLALANTPTRLKALPQLLRERLINWGYAVCDAAIRRHVDGKLPAPADFPFPDAGV